MTQQLTLVSYKAISNYEGAAGSRISTKKDKTLILVNTASYLLASCHFLKTFRAFG